MSDDDPLPPVADLSSFERPNISTIWLTVMTTRIYRRELGGLLLDRPQWAPALAFYLRDAEHVALVPGGPQHRKARAVLIGFPSNEDAGDCVAAIIAAVLIVLNIKLLWDLIAA